ncbi:MAG: DUF2238 domain-containing protein [Planctomycetota bacterium]
MPEKARFEPAPSRGLLGLAAFTSAYMGVASFAAWHTGNQEFLFYIGVMVVLIGAVLLVRHRAGFSRGLLWALAIWGLAHMAGGLMPVPGDWPIAGDIRVLYSWWLIPNYLKYDHVVHAYGFGVTTWACWQGLQRATGVSRPTLGLLVLCAAGGMGFGAANEIVEFLATLLVPSTNVGGYENTGWDLVANFIGSGIAGFLIGWRSKA